MMVMIDFEKLNMDQQVEVANTTKNTEELKAMLNLNWRNIDYAIAGNPNITENMVTELYDSYKDSESRMIEQLIKNKATSYRIFHEIVENISKYSDYCWTAVTESSKLKYEDIRILLNACNLKARWDRSWMVNIIKHPLTTNEMRLEIVRNDRKWIEEVYKTGNFELVVKN